MSAKGSVYFINGTVRINDVDVATISAVDSSVLLKIAQEQKKFSGNRITTIETHTTSVEATLKISKPVLNKSLLEKALGMIAASGTLDDGASASTNYGMSLATGYNRPEMSILISGADDKTGKKIEIEAAKCVLTNDIDILLSKEDLAQPELEFLILGDTDNPSTNMFEVRFED